EALPSPVLERALETVRRTEDSLGDDGEAIIASARYEVVDSLVRGIYQKSEKGGKSVTDRIDEVVTNRWLAIPIFAAVMFLVYYLSITSVGGYMTDWVNETVFEENVLPRTADWLAGMGVEDWLVSLIVNGIITGVGAVLGFLPQLLVLFLLLALLEDSGYMARIAFVMDRILRRFGLSGKSFIPIIVGTGCAVPGIMASRTIEDERDRKITAMTTSFMPCSAKLPVIALISGALFGGSAWIAVSVYFIGVFSILVSGVILKKIRGAFGKASPFVMELPDYHVPSARNVVLSMGDRSWHFVKKAGTIIVLASGLIWLLTSYDWSLNPVGAESSMLASIGNALSPAFSPLGWGDWRAVVGTLSGLVAKENILSTFGILFGIEAVAEDGAEIWTYMATIMSPLAGFSFLLFNMLCAPCFAAIGAMRRELGSWKETALAVGYQCAFAYVVALAVYQFGLAIQGTPSFWLIPAALLVIGTGYLFFRNPGEPEDEVPAEAA
ncbi:MAG: ferrous iron transport protein B, partial [Candidatus Methanomethylophilaceae archaeon]